jgi:hypothetical protein
MSPGKDNETNWLPAPDGPFSLYIRPYWADKVILDEHVEAARRHSCGAVTMVQVLSRR